MLVAVISSLLLATCYLSASRLYDRRLIPPRSGGCEEARAFPANPPTPPLWLPYNEVSFNNLATIGFNLLSPALPVPCTPADSR